MGMYIRDRRTGRVRPTEDLHEWVINREKNKRVELTHVGNCSVSTVFLGLDHNYSQVGPPIVYETMVFCRDDFQECYARRYATEEESMLGHRLAIEFTRRRFVNKVKIGNRRFWFEKEMGRSWKVRKERNT